jgi:predicted enzyme related to lactoylglutathione lyase
VTDVSGVSFAGGLCPRYDPGKGETAYGENAMAVKQLACAGVMLILVGVAQAGVTLNAGRVGAEDVAALAKFYESAFGLKEVNRLQFPGMLEIMMNFGDTVEAAKSNPNAQIVIMHRDSNAIKDPVPHLIFNVTDVAATAAAVKAAGGTMEGEPRAFGKTGIMIGLAVDPAGNRLEMIQQPKH